MDNTETAFGVLLVVYMVYSQWARLDSRWPVVGGILLFLAAGGLEATRNFAAAQVVALYAILVLAAGTVLIIVDQLRDARARSRERSAPRPKQATSDAPNEGNPASEQALHGLEQ